MDEKNESHMEWGRTWGSKGGGRGRMMVLASLQSWGPHLSALTKHQPRPW